MTAQAIKATLYLGSTMHKTLEMRAAETSQIISGLMNEALQARLSDNLADINSIRNRLA